MDQKENSVYALLFGLFGVEGYESFLDDED